MLFKHCPDAPQCKYVLDSEISYAAVDALSKTVTPADNDVIFVYGSSEARAAVALGLRHNQAEVVLVTRDQPTLFAERTLQAVVGESLENVVEAKSDIAPTILFGQFGTLPPVAGKDADSSDTTRVSWDLCALDFSATSGNMRNILDLSGQGHLFTATKVPISQREYEQGILEGLARMDAVDHPLDDKEYRGLGYEDDPQIDEKLSHGTAVVYTQLCLKSDALGSPGLSIASVDGVELGHSPLSLCANAGDLFLHLEDLELSHWADARLCGDGTVILYAQPQDPTSFGQQPQADMSTIPESYLSFDGQFDATIDGVGPRISVRNAPRLRALCLDRVLNQTEKRLHTMAIQDPMVQKVQRVVGKHHNIKPAAVFMAVHHLDGIVEKLGDDAPPREFLHDLLRHVGRFPDTLQKQPEAPQVVE